MLLIETELRETKNKRHPISLFSKQFIAQGEVIWVFDPRFDIEIDSEDLLEIPEHAKKFLTKNAFRSEDGSTLINCSMFEPLIRASAKSFNIAKDREYLKGDWYAVRDIEPGEELISSR